MRERDRVRFFYVPPERLAAPSFEFPEDERDHLTKVLRLSTGDLVTAVDGAGNGACVRLRMETGGVRGEVVERFRSTAEPALRLTLAVGLVRGQEMDAIVERGAELGVDALLPLICERSVHGGTRPERGGRAERWRRLALSGMKVARGGVAMEVLDPVRAIDLGPAIRERGGAILWRREAPPLLPVGGREKELALIGPEGGFTEAEEEVFLRAGATPASLGPRNLRTGTACAAALALLLLAGRGDTPGGA
jgi:16S rRNA (uracil1498-N3)-methyltransferase